MECKDELISANKKIKELSESLKISYREINWMTDYIEYIEHNYMFADAEACDYADGDEQYKLENLHNG